MLDDGQNFEPASGSIGWGEPLVRVGTVVQAREKERKKKEEEEEIKAKFHSNKQQSGWIISLSRFKLRLNSSAWMRIKLGRSESSSPPTGRFTPEDATSPKFSTGTEEKLRRKPSEGWDMEEGLTAEFVGVELLATRHRGEEEDDGGVAAAAACGAAGRGGGVMMVEEEGDG